MRDGGSWSPQLELDLDIEGYYSLISLPLSHGASQWALEQAARRGAMKREAIWSDHAFVECDSSLNTAIQKNRQALENSAANP